MPAGLRALRSSIAAARSSPAIPTRRRGWAASCPSARSCGPDARAERRQHRTSRAPDETSRSLRLHAGPRPSRHGLRLVIGVPRATGLRRDRAAPVRGNCWCSLMVALLTLAFAWVGAERFVLRRVASLLEATRRLAAGDPGGPDLAAVRAGRAERAGPRVRRDGGRAAGARGGAAAGRAGAARERGALPRVHGPHARRSPSSRTSRGGASTRTPHSSATSGCTREQWFGRTDAEMWPGPAGRRRSSRRDDLRVLATERASPDPRDDHAARWDRRLTG